MTYYEELDVPATASADEIRHSYKALARLLHPDQCPDANLKHLAELQMRRLNRILAVLSDPEERRRYDAGLKAPPAPVRRYAGPMAPPRRPSLGQRRWFVGLCVWLAPVTGLALFVAALLYYEPGFSPAPLLPAAVSDAVETSASPRVSPPAPEPLEEPRSLPPEISADPRDLLARLQSSQAELARLRAEHRRVLAQLEPPARATLREESLPEPPPVASRPAPDLHAVLPAPHLDRAAFDRAPPQPSKFAGDWYFVPPARQAASPGIYVPEYIELHMSESAGLLRGRYQARYRITDRALDPHVAFQFEGSAGAPAAQFPWTGPGGSAGKLTLRLLSADQLEVTWIASRLGSSLSLASGAAQLIRQQESSK